jgi:cytochrome bd ubiquinol oxidase subunit II
VVALFVALFPNVMISSTAANFNLTIYNASSTPYTLKVMTIVACILVPIVLAYQIWTYWVFKKRIKADAKSLTY